MMAVYMDQLSVYLDNNPHIDSAASARNVRRDPCHYPPSCVVMLASAATTTKIGFFWMLAETYDGQVPIDAQLHMLLVREDSL